MKKNLWLSLVLICLNMAFIWGNSLMPAEESSAFSQQVMDICIQPILEFLGETALPEAAPEGGEMHLLRKMAHFGEFMLLGANLSWLFHILEQKPLHRFTMPLLLGMLTALLDETIQLSSPGRSGQITDVWIDTAGLALGIILVLTGYSIWTKHKKKTIHGG